VGGTHIKHFENQSLHSKAKKEDGDMHAFALFSTYKKHGNIKTHDNILL
jgi:hypothetical protein